MKRFAYFLSAMLLVGIIFLMGCEGPAGPAGANGSNGKDATQICSVCHGQTTTNNVLEKIDQYELSLHGTGIVFEEEAGRAQCNACHTGDGYVEAAKLGTLDPIMGGSSAINCFACHDLHNKFDTTDWKLRIAKAVVLRQTPTAGQTMDFGGVGNTCATCHQARPISHVYSKNDPTKDSLAKNSSGTYSRIGPHYGIIANVVAGIGIEPMTGLTVTTDNPHKGLTKGCVDCHMATDTTNHASGGHTFLMTQANFQKMSDADWASKKCGTCHSKAKVTTAAIAKQMATDIAGIRRILINASLLDTTQAVSTEGYKVIGEYVAALKTGPKLIGKDTVSALIDYLYVAKDRSNGAHNPDLMRAMVTSRIVAMSFCEPRS